MEFWETTSYIERNNATISGGGVYSRQIGVFSAFTPVIELRDNVAGDAGGNVALVGNSVQLFMATVVGGQAARGGGVYVAGTGVVLRDLVLEYNSATLAGGHGGGLYADSGSSVTLTNVPVVNVSGVAAVSCAHTSV